MSLEEIFSIKNIIIYLIIINLIAFLAMWLDKRKAEKGRIQRERYLQRSDVSSPLP